MLDDSVVLNQVLIQSYDRYLDLVEDLLVALRERHHDTHPTVWYESKYGYRSDTCMDARLPLPTDGELVVDGSGPS